MTVMVLLALLGAAVWTVTKVFPNNHDPFTVLHVVKNDDTKQEKK